MTLEFDRVLAEMFARDPQPNASEPRGGSQCGHIADVITDHDRQPAGKRREPRKRLERRGRN